MKYIVRNHKRIFSNETPEDNEVELSNYIKNDEIFEHVIIYNKAESKKYKEVLTKIKDIVKHR